MKERALPLQNLERLSQLDYVAILFVPKDLSLAQSFQGKFSQLHWPLGFERWFIVLDEKDPVCTHFGIYEAPSLVISHRGMLLAMVDECHQEACDWLVSFARQQAAKC